VPLLMFMTFSLDIRSSTDQTLLYVYVIAQQISVVTGCMANLTTNYTLAVILLVISCVSFLSIYVAVYFSFRRINIIASDELKLSSASTIRADRLSQILSKVENVGIVISFQLSLYCATFWTIIAVTYFLGVFNIYDHTTEACIQAAVDVLTKCLYTQVLCSSHGAVLSPEGILMRLLILEERANAAFRQVTSTYILLHRLD
jgi:hypothetical protein